LSQPFPDAVIKTLYHNTPVEVEGGVYVAVLNPGPLAFPHPEVPFGLVCHVYPIVPVPFVTTTFNWDVPPKHSITDVGWEVMVRSGVIVTVTTLLMT
jgi:hypothetical protein